MTSRTRTRPGAVLATLLATAAIGAGVASTPALASTPGSAATPAPARPANPDATATQLLNRFPGALADDDQAKLGALLSPAWMIQRASGVAVTSQSVPRLSTFTWQRGGWRMTSHANFNPPG